MPFQEYKEIVGSVAGIVTVAQFFSPVFICKQIISQGNTENVDSTPFVGGIAMGFLFLRHGFILDDPTMIGVNLFAIGLNAIYFLLFVAYSENKGNVLLRLLKTLVVAFLVIAATFLNVEKATIEFSYGTFVTLMMFCLIAAPLKDLGTIIEKKDTSSLPFPMILAGTITVSLWLLYGIILENEFIIVQNLVGLILSSTQLALFVIYPTKSKVKKVD